MTVGVAEVAERSLATVVNHLAALLARPGGVLSQGDVAALRRMDPRRIDAPGFYKLLGDLPGLSPGGAAREDQETRWAAVIVALSHLRDLHRPGARLGHALVRAGFSEPRFVRLLRADAERLVDEIPAVARFLAAKGVPADFVAGARLLLSAGRVDEERARRELARDYYRASYHQAND